MAAIPGLLRTAGRRFLRNAVMGGLLLAAATVAAGAAPAGYAEGLEDVPLMPGLTALPAETLVFDKPGGRIVQSSAHGAVTATAVRRFYQETLPQLGWRATGSRRFIRSGEVLRLEISGKEPLTVRFTLSPE